MGCSSNNSTMKPKTKPRIIGGMFGLEEILNANNSAPKFLAGNNIFLLNARSCIWFLVKHLSPSQVWVPSYLCGSICEALNAEEIIVRFYEVDYNLMIPSLHWLDSAAG